MISRLSSILPSLALVFLASLSYWLSIGMQSLAPGGDRSTARFPDVIVENFSAHKLNESGNLQVELHAEKAVHFASDDSSELEVVRLLAYSLDKPPLITKAPKGDVRHLADGDEVRLSGGVTIESAQSASVPAMSMITPSIVIWPDSGIARSTAGVKLSSNTSTVSAARLEIDTNSRRISMQDISATLLRNKGR